VNQNCLKERQKILETKKSGRLKLSKALLLVNNFFKIATVVCWINYSILYVKVYLKKNFVYYINNVIEIF